MSISSTFYAVYGPQVHCRQNLDAAPLAHLMYGSPTVRPNGGVSPHPQISRLGGVTSGHRKSASLFISNKQVHTDLGDHGLISKC